MRKFIQCVSNENYLVTPLQTIEEIKNAGFDGVFLQWYNNEQQVSQQMQLKTAQNLNLTVPFVHLGYKTINTIWDSENHEGENLVQSYINDLDVCKQNGINMVVMHLTSKTTAPAPNQTGIKRFEKIIRHAEKIGVKIAFENTKIWGYLEYLFSNIASDNIGICFDVGHCHAHFDDKFSWEMFKNKIFAVHLHDNDKSEDQHLLPFEGTINWEEMINNLKNANYSGPIILESVYREGYSHLSLKEFYERAFLKAKQIEKMLK